MTKKDKENLKKKSSKLGILSFTPATSLTRQNNNSDSEAKPKPAKESSQKKDK